VNGAPESRIVAFARLIRWAIVDSGTKNARAISAVVRPPTARSVSASCDAPDSAGWQQRKSSVSVSSSSGAVSSGPAAWSASGGSRAAAVASRRSRARSARSWSVMRRDATAISQPLGLSGMPSPDHCVAAARSASWTGVLRRVEAAVAADDRAEDLRGELAQQVLDPDRGRVERHPVTSRRRRPP
jgi:hypothetical protein